MSPHPRWNRVFRTFMSNVNKQLLVVRAVLGMLILLVAVNACVIAYFEGMKITDSLYFAFVTAFTIGYGDIAPVTAGGRIVSLLVGVLGLIFTGLIVAIATRALAETYRDVGNGEKE